MTMYHRLWTALRQRLAAPGGRRALPGLGWLRRSGGAAVKARPRTTLSAVVIRADGTREDLGVISVNGRPRKRR